MKPCFSASEKMKRREENEEDTKIGNHNSNQHDETEEDNNNYKLSDFPDCILLHILSFMNGKDAVRTCLLSTRWKHLWRSLPTLTLTSNFPMAFIKISRSFNSFDVELVRCVQPEPHVVSSIARYVVSQNVNRLRLGLSGFDRFPFSLLSCRSLTSLDIMILGFGSLPFLNSLNLPSLTYLKLYKLDFYNGNDGRVEPFSTFNRLNTLILDFCEVQDAKRLCISSTTLINLSIRTDYYLPGRHLKNEQLELFTPSLCTFSISCNSFQKLSGSHLSSIKQVSILVYDESKKYPEKSSLGIFNWFAEMTNIESLTVTPETLQVLSLYPNILKLKLTSWCKLKSLKLSLNLNFCSQRKVKMELAGGKSWKENVKLREIIKAEFKPIYLSIFDGMIDFLLQNSPSAKVDILLGN